LFSTIKKIFKNKTKQKKIKRGGKRRPSVAEGGHKKQKSNIFVLFAQKMILQKSLIGALWEAPSPSQLTSLALRSRALRPEDKIRCPITAGGAKTEGGFGPAGEGSAAKANKPAPHSTINKRTQAAGTGRPERRNAAPSGPGRETGLSSRACPSDRKAKAC